ncbi:RNA polymerase II subunit 5-mediating protein [Dictyostelium discoideum AX4]|uniref:RNA polymerase II subunit 5-mediating protein homolog n=1 Tax=Dictyostelium discoideum TaxID=44689 RepID=RMP_DICDI|nr:RNA polymerase II subunit 5-mediating protein [Dictyostelium discoideum AX4]Q54HG4.2 RecName: Full=RNA polymerase II subunit 5-mediating protein homolog; Short=RPB5-mediating protein homolog [Dictyostelium discoideum]EAL62718.2 RNA polymerase II subunit 5-mediating protein [Dictyostelium discoideum AX4]|eukprot:XP_636221.2 RNA polymerase II subunit 5-mediating protein [Dictyostelium discoideum AX4]
MSSQEIFKKYEQKVVEYQDHIEELKSTKNDYKQLIDTLQHLPDTLQPKIMVPMGKLAFFEGNLKNTNEILILLGDNYFAKRSSKQTIDIIQRRDKDIDTSINDLREQIKGLKQRVSMTTDLSKALHEKEYDNIVEIKEEYNSDEEREKEKKRKQKPQKSTTTTTTTTTSKDKPKTEEEKKKSKEMDEEFDKMLKRLSILEEKENKMGDDYDEEEFNKKFNKKLDITGSDEEYDDDNYNNNNDDDDDNDEDDDREYYQEEGFEDEKPENSNYNKNIEEDDHDDDDDYYDEGEEIVEYYDENGNIVDINDPNVEYIQGDDDNDDNDNEEDEVDVELNESELEEIKDFHMDKKGQDLSEKEVKELTDFYHSKQKKRISYIDTPQPPTPEATTSITPKSILKTNSSGNLMSTIPKSYNENDENDIRRYIKNLDKQEKFENQKTISVPNPPKDVAFSGDIVEKETDLFPFDEIPKPTPPSNAKQSRFKSSRQNK